MIIYAQGTDLFLYPQLALSMFNDRKEQFSDRLGWPVDIDGRQLERDQYDKLNPIYVIAQSEDGSYAGSMRLMPTTGRTMINEHFTVALGGAKICDRDTWECTRFCISSKQSKRTAIALFAAAGFLMQEFEVKNLVAVFNEKMQRIYNINGVPPKVLGQQQTDDGVSFAGRWVFHEELLARLTRASGFSADLFNLCLVNSTIFESRDILVA